MHYAQEHERPRTRSVRMGRKAKATSGCQLNVHVRPRCPRGSRYLGRP